MVKYLTWTEYLKEILCSLEFLNFDDDEGNLFLFLNDANLYMA